MTNILKSLAFACALLWANAVLGQAKPDTPKIVEVITEGQPAADGSGLAAVLAGLRSRPESSGLRWIAGTVVAGDLNHTVAIFLHQDYASLARSSDALKGAWQNLAAADRPKLQSRVYDFAPEQTFNDGHVLWREARAFVLFFTELSTGGADDYAEQQKIAASYLAKANVQDEEWQGFSMRFGHGSPEYVFVTPLKSIAELDSNHSHGDVLPPEVDKARSLVLLRAVKSNSLLLVQVRPEISSIH